MADAARCGAGETGAMCTPRPAGRWLARCLLVVGAALVAVAVLGPLVTGAIHWRIRPTVLNQLYGLDAVSLFLVAPTAGLAARLVARGSRRAPLLALAVCGYAVYVVPQYVLGPDYSHSPGDNERWFPLLLVLFAVGVIGAVLSWVESAHGAPTEPASPGEQRIGRVLLPAVAAVVFVRYIPALADWMSGSPRAKDYLAGPGFSWAIGLLDLGVALPATAAVCIGYRRGAGWARRALYALTAWFALVGAAVAGMAIAMQVRGDSAMTAPKMGLMAVLGGALVSLAMNLWVPAVNAPRPAAGRSRPPVSAQH
jgi:hypothetical protein